MKTCVIPYRGNLLAGMLATLLASPSMSALARDAQTTNEAVLDAFAQQAGDMAPQLARGPDGGVRLEWRIALTGERYHNEITPPPGSGNLATPFGTGTFNKWSANTEIRLLEQSGAQSLLRGTLTGSNDRAVLSRYNQQVTQLQLSRQAGAFNATAGDVLAGFSPLGSTLGLRGIQVSHTLGPFGVSAHTGVVAESWEALMNRSPLDGQPTRNIYLRDVYGVKGEYSHSPALKGWVSWQGFNDRRESLLEAQRQSPDLDTRAVTGGFAWQDALGSLTGEWGTSTSNRGEPAARRADAWILDGTLRLGQWSLRGGFHDVGADYLSLAQTLPPGIRETYLGADWTATPWLTLGADWRDSSTRFAKPTASADDSLFGQSTLLPASLAAGLNFRATINFGPQWPGWTLSLQNGETANESQPGSRGRGRNTTASLGFAVLDWNGNLGLTDGYNNNAAAPQSDSTMQGWQLSLGRGFTLGNASGQPWMLNVSLNAGRQDQHLVFLAQTTRSRQHGVTASVQHPRHGQLNLQWSDAFLLSTMGGPELLTRTVNLDYTRPVLSSHSMRAYWRLGRRNIGEPTLETTERGAGLQLNLTW